MPRISHDDPDRCLACPDCDSAGEVYRRTHEHKEYDREYRCHDCGATFDEPVERESRQGNTDGRTADGIPSAFDPELKAAIRAARGDD